jgi:hypothetical protein
MAVFLSPVGGAAVQFFDNSGQVLTGGLLYTYLAGTTTPAATYTSNTGTQFHTNPIILDASGRIPNGGEVWLAENIQYKFVLKDSNSVLIGTWDNIIGINSNFLNYSVQEETQTATQGQTVFTLATISYTPATNTLSVYVNGSKQIPVINYVETDATTVTFISGLNVGDIVDFTTAVSLSSGVTAANLVTFTGFKGQTGTVQDLADDNGSDWVGFIADSVDAVAISAQDKMRQTISVKDFGAVGDGIVDDTVSIQNAIDYVQSLQNRPTILFPVGIYKVTSTITVTSDNVSLVGLGTPSVGSGSQASPTAGITRGATLRYYGTGTALLIGVSPNVTGDFINEIWVQNLRIEVDNNTSCAMHVWMSNQSYFKNINIFGNKWSDGGSLQFGTGNCGLKVSGTISTIFEQIDINGLGQDTVPNAATWLNFGLVAGGGYSGSVITTTIFRRCYFHYCNSGAWVSTITNFEDCIFEANDQGFIMATNSTTSINRGWWESNGTFDINFQGGNNCLIKDSNINSYTRQQFFINAGVNNLTIEDTAFSTSNANSRLFGPAGSNYIFNTNDNT